MAWAWPHLWSWCLIYRWSIVSVRVHSRSLSLSTRGRSDGGLACRSKPGGGSFNKSLMTPERLQKSKSERRVPLYSAQWKGEGNQREGGESEGVSERGKTQEVTIGHTPAFQFPTGPPHSTLSLFAHSSSAQQWPDRTHFFFFFYMQHISLPKFQQAWGRFCL